MTSRLFLMLACVLAVPCSHAASFDCTKNLTAAERSICNDSELSVMDDALSAIYAKLVLIKPDFRNSQSQWLRLRNQCADASCIKDAYRKQLISFAAQIPVSKRTADAQNSNAYSGNWTNDFRQNAKSECGFASFSLSVSGPWISGSHSMATEGCGRLNEEGPVVGVIKDSDAILIVTSGRNEAIVLGRAQHSKEGLLWKTQVQLSPGSPEGDDLIFNGGKFTRAKNQQ